MSYAYGPPEPRNESCTKGSRPTAREREVLELVVCGLSNVEIAERLGVSIKTVEEHLSSVRYKTGIGPRVLLAFWWRDQEAEAS